MAKKFYAFYYGKDSTGRRHALLIDSKGYTHTTWSGDRKEVEKYFRDYIKSAGKFIWIDDIKAEENNDLLEKLTANYKEKPKWARKKQSKK